LFQWRIFDIHQGLGQKPIGKFVFEALGPKSSGDLAHETPLKLTDFRALTKNTGTQKAPGARS
jgi:hypothetical protein